MNYLTKILVIDDDQRLGITIKNVLSFHGYDVCYANNGALGIQKVFEYTPDLILCDINMDSIDGFQVFNVLKESSLLDQIPFIFITGNSDLKDIRLGMVLGADDYFVKPFNNEDLITTIEKRLSKFKKLKEIGRHEFNALFQVTPNGIFLFDGHMIIDANPALLNMVGLKKGNITSYSIEDIIDPVSYLTIEDKINRCSKGILNFFSEKVEIKSANNKKLEVNLVVSVYEKFSGHSLMAGLCTRLHTMEEENEDFFLDMLKVLKKENVVVTDSLGKQLTEVFRKQNKYLDRQVEDFFSKRESEVLCLSMEGLPMKLIADKLCISSRTVEKHRANLMEKTNSKNMIEVIIYALRNNLIEI
ncbi:MAG TPA: response regulator [Prolixibacteraceae bacterium]|nr:response regulator [Prolixibacteraceae bacterium]